MPAPDHGERLSGHPGHGSSEPPPPPPSVNPHAWAHILGWGIAAVVLLTILSARVDHHDPSAAYRAGIAFVPVILTAIAAAYVIRSLNRPVSWPIYPLVLLLGSGVLYLVAQVGSIQSGHPGTGPTQTVRLSQTVGQWHQLHDPDTQALLKTMRTRASEALGYVPRLAYYRSADGTTIFVHSLDQAPDAMKAEFTSSPAQAVVNMLGGVGVTNSHAEDPGKLGGQMACGTAPQAGHTPRPACAWVNGTLGVEVVFVTGELSLHDAYSSTRAFRDAITSPR